MIRCLECMEEYEEGLRQCPYCGAGQVWMQEEKNYLSPGIKLQNRYIAGTVQAKRETDIIYIGWDTIFERKVLIQEFFPDYCVSRSDGKGEMCIRDRLAGEYTGFTFDVSDGSEIVMGRDASVCQIVFNQFQSKVSRLHCKIHYDAKTDNYYVTNYSATSGTFTENGTRFEEGTAKLVARGTIIYLGDKANSFRLE